MPFQLTPDKIDHDLEFEWLLCLSSRLQSSQLLRPTKVGWIQRHKELPALTTSRSLGENPSARSSLDKKYRNHEAKRGASVSS